MGGADGVPKAYLKELPFKQRVASPLIEIVDQFLAEDGVFVISGIIDTKEKEIADKLNAYGFDVIETRRMKDWVSMTAKMR